MADIFRFPCLCLSLLQIAVVKRARTVFFEPSNRGAFFLRGSLDFGLGPGPLVYDFFSFFFLRERERGKCFIGCVWLMGLRLCTYGMGLLHFYVLRCVGVVYINVYCGVWKNDSKMKTLTTGFLVRFFFRGLVLFWYLFVRDQNRKDFAKLPFYILWDIPVGSVKLASLA